MAFGYFSLIANPDQRSPQPFVLHYQTEEEPNPTEVLAVTTIYHETYTFVPGAPQGWLRLIDFSLDNESLRGTIVRPLALERPKIIQTAPILSIHTRGGASRIVLFEMDAHDNLPGSKIIEPEDFSRLIVAHNRRGFSIKTGPGVKRPALATLSEPPNTLRH